MIKNISYSLLTFIIGNLFPLITFPFVCRILGPEEWGYYNLVNSVIILITLISSFGINIYGVQKIGENLDKPEVKKTLLAELTILNLCLSLIAYLGVLVFTLFNTNELENNLFRILGLLPILNAISVDWYYIGIEKNNKLFFRNIISKSFFIFLIFSFLKDDYLSLKYASFVVISATVNVLFSFFDNKKILEKKIIVSVKSILGHIKSLKNIFSFEILYRLLSVSDIIILEFFVMKKEIGLFSFANTLIIVMATFLKSISMVILPRISLMRTKNQLEKLKELNNFILETFILAGLFCIFLLFTFSNQIVYMLGGIEYQGSVIILLMLSPIILLSTLVNYIIFQILIPFGEIKKLIVVLSIFAILNVCCNIIVIPIFGIAGNIIIAIATQIFLLIIFLIISPKNIIGAFSPFKIIFLLISLFLIIYLCNQLRNWYHLTWYLHGFISLICFSLTLLIGNRNWLLKWKSLKL